MSCITVKCSNCVVYLYDMCKAVRVRDPGEGGPHLEQGRRRRGELQLIDTFTSAKTGSMVEFRKAERT